MHESRSDLALSLSLPRSSCTTSCQVGPTTFTGYSATSGTGRVVGLMRDGRAVEAVQAGGCWGRARWKLEAVR